MEIICLLDAFLIGLECYTNTMRHFGVNVTLAFDFVRDIEKLIISDELSYY